MVKRLLIPIISFILAVVIIISCSKNSLESLSFNETGSISPKLLFKRNASIIQIPLIVKTVRAKVTVGTFEKTAVVPYDAHTLEITKIPVGKGVLTIDGLDADSQVIYQGTSEIEISEKFTAQPMVVLNSTKPIVLQFISPSDNATVGASSSITLNGSTSCEYGLSSMTIDSTAVAVTGGLWSNNVNLVDGKNVFIFKVIDQKGNVLLDTLTLNFHISAIDNSGPTVIVMQPSKGDSVGTRTITVSGTVDDPSGVASLTVNGTRINLTGKTWESSVTLDTGLNKIIIIATDNSSLQNTKRDTIPVYYNAAVKDTNPPELIINSPKNNDTVNTSMVQLSISAADLSGVSSITVNGVSANEANGLWVATAGPLANGLNKLIIVATDSKSLQKKDSLFIIYDSLAKDTTRPIITITSPVNNAIYSTPSINVRGNATDRAGIYSVVVNNTIATYSNGSWNSTVNLTGKTNKITAVARDTKGNSDSTSIMVIYDPTLADTLKPIISIQDFRNGDTISVSNVNLKISSSDESGIDSLTVNGIKATPRVNDVYTATVVLLPGLNSIKIISIDKSYNHNIETSSISLYFDSTATDTTPPTLSVQSHTAGQTVSLSNVPLRITAIDKNGISSVKINGTEASSATAGEYTSPVNLTAGPNTIRIIAVDNSSHHNQRTLDFPINYDPTASDSVKPTISFIGISDKDLFTKDSLKIKVLAQDANGISSVKINSVNAVYDSGFYYVQYKLTDTTLITVIAIDSSSVKNSQTSSITLFYDKPPLAVIISPCTTATKNSAPISWGISTDNNFVSYIVYHSTASTFSQSLPPDTIITAKNFNSYTIKNLSPGTSYYCWIKVNDSHSSVLSNRMNFTTVSLPVLPPVANLRGQVLSMSSTFLKWTTASGASLYRIYRNTPPSNLLLPIGTTQSLSFVDSTCKDSTLYRYKVSYLDFNNNESLLSDSVTIFTFRKLISNGDLSTPIVNGSEWSWDPSKVDVTYDPTRGHSGNGCITIKGKGTVSSTTTTRVFMPGSSAFDPSMLYSEGITKLSYKFYAKSGKTGTSVVRKSTMHALYQIAQTFPLEYRDYFVGGWQQFWAAGLVDTMWTLITLDPNIPIVDKWTNSSGEQCLANGFRVYIEIIDTTSILLLDDFMVTPITDTTTLAKQSALSASPAVGSILNPNSFSASEKLFVRRNPF